MSGMAETRAIKFCTQKNYIKSCQRDDKSPLKGACFCSRDPFCMGNCGLRKILHCTEARAVSCDKQFAATIADRKYGAYIRPKLHRFDLSPYVLQSWLYNI